MSSVSTPLRRWPVALVTGASSGIGQELARLLAADGSQLVVVARTTEALEALATELDHKHGTEVEVISADLSTSEGMAGVEARLAEPDRPIDLLVNNAGFGLSGKFHTQDPDELQRMLELNVVALTRLTRAAVGPMVVRGSGGILNVSSVGGFVPSFGYAAYGASKSYVTAFSETVREELRGSGVHVTVLAPGFTRTGFQSTSGNEAQGVPEFMWQSAREVAAAGLTAVAKNRAVWVPGVTNQASIGMMRLVPRAVQRRISGKIVDRF